MGKKRTNPWERWSPSKLGLFFECPLSFYFEYIENIKNEVKQGIPKVFGQAIHHMLEDFFQKQYKTREKFLNAWKFYWLFYIFEKKYKFKVRMNDLDDRQKYLAIGIKILKIFWEKNIRYRDDELLKPQTEKRFSRIFKGHRIVGVMDRIQPVEPVEKGDVEIWDYKTGWKKPREQELLRDVQFTFYNLDYFKEFGKDPIRMRLDHLFSGEQLIIPIRTKDDYTQLGQWLDEASVYVENILNPHSQRNWKDITFKWLNPEDIERKYFPKRPSDFCDLCDYYQLCREYKPPDSIREKWIELELQRTGPYPKCEQLEISFPKRKTKSLR